MSAQTMEVFREPAQRVLREEFGDAKGTFSRDYYCSLVATKWNMSRDICDIIYFP